VRLHLLDICDTQSEADKYVLCKVMTSCPVTPVFKYLSVHVASSGHALHMPLWPSADALSAVQDCLLQAALSPPRDARCRAVVELAASVGVMYLSTQVRMACAKQQSSRHVQRCLRTTQN
jgi:hypothetical protein